jgi:hypothetical protein
LRIFKYIFFILIISFSIKGYSQTDTLKSVSRQAKDQNATPVDSSKQRDFADEIYQLLGKSAALKKTAHSKKINISVVPAIGYSLTTGFAVDVTSNAAFYTSSTHDENLSQILSSIAYDTKSQKFFISQSEIWAHHNDYKFVSNIRVEEYPIDTYGLGSNTSTATTDPIKYDYIKFYGTIYKRFLPDFYLGTGYDIDYHYNITEMGNQDHSIPDFNKYGFTTQSTSSGITLDALYDSRRNPINPLGGAYASLTYRQNSTLLGSNASWHSFLLDLRRYIKLSPSSNNILAFWGMAWVSSAGTPYLDLPATGMDNYNNSGRGYAQGRFTGKDMLYLESEYRFGITPNGLLGGVLFVNGETLTNYPENQFQKIAPAVGTGIRIKANKHSDSNICIDYGVGLYNSRGFFVNLGEVF